MASTGKTTNYELSQFIGTNKPSWLGDYNGDMLKIDTALGSINATATTAQSGVASAQSAASAAQQTANAANTKANQNETQIEKIENYFSFNSVAFTSINHNTGALWFVGSGIMGALKGSASFSSVPSSSALVGTDNRIPFASAEGNIFQLVVSTLSDTQNKLYLGNASVRYNTDKLTSSALGAYYDGTNTIIYLSLANAIFSTLTAINSVWGTFPWFNAGVTFNV